MNWSCFFSDEVRHQTDEVGHCADAGRRYRDGVGIYSFDYRLDTDGAGQCLNDAFHHPDRAGHCPFDYRRHEDAPRRDRDDYGQWTDGALSGRADSIFDRQRSQMDLPDPDSGLTESRAWRQRSTMRMND